MEDTRKSIIEMARGAFIERVDYEMNRVVDNILDPNTKATEKRKVTITLTLQPDDLRQNVNVAFAVKSALAATNPLTTSLYIAGEATTGEMQVVEMTPNIPGQMSIDGTEQEAPSMLKLIHAV